jgi:hypothetical protein
LVSLRPFATRSASERIIDTHIDRFSRPFPNEMWPLGVFAGMTRISP